MQAYNCKIILLQHLYCSLVIHPSYDDEVSLGAVLFVITWSASVTIGNVLLKS